MKSKWIRILCLVLVCFMAFCMIAIITRIYTVSDLQLNFMGVLLGTLITAIVTALLLSGQSAAEEVKERNVKVFEKKSEIFQNYIDIVWDIWEDHAVTSEEYLKLTSMYYKQLMLYLNKKSLEVIGEELSKIGSLIDDDNKSNKEDQLQNSLIKIINVLSDEISLGGHIDLDRFKDLDQKMEVARTRRQRTTFKLLKIKIGTELVYKKDNSIKCITVDENNGVEYSGKPYTISGLSNELTGISTNGFDYFMFNGKTLWEMRKKLENN